MVGGQDDPSPLVYHNQTGINKTGILYFVVLLLYILHMFGLKMKKINTLPYPHLAIGPSTIIIEGVN